jgi:hypothetical protein
MAVREGFEPNDRILHVSLEIPLVAGDSELLSLVTESIAHVNGCMILGHIDLNMDSGEN